MKIDRKKLISITILLSLLGTLALSTSLAFSDDDLEIELEPSGDMTGITDANNIEAALEVVKASGGTVELEEGCYYVSRPIVVEEFNGVLKGDDMDETVITAVRKSSAPGDGFGFTTKNPPGWPLPMMFSFPNPTGKLVIKDLSLQVLDPAPADLYTDQYGDDSHALHVFILTFKGNCITMVKNVKLKGADGDFREKNMKYAIVRALGEGNINIRNCEFENIGGECNAVFWMKNSFISITNCISNNAMFVYHVNNIDSHTIIKKNTVSGTDLWDALWIFNSENVYISKNTFKDFTIHLTTGAIIRLKNSHGCTITKNKFINILSILGKGAIWLWGDSSSNTIQRNDYSQSGLPGWTDCTVYPPEGLGYILLGPDTTNNNVYEYVPENQVCDFGTDNTIITDYND